MLGLLCLFALTANTVTQTNSVAPQTSFSIASHSDTRLNALCELHCKGVALRDVFKDLEKQTKVKIEMRGKWTGDLRAAIFTKPMPLRAMMSRISSLFHLSWKAGGENAKEETYVFYESPANKKYAQDIRDVGWRSVLASLRKGKEYAALPPEELSGRAERGDQLARELLISKTDRDLLTLFWELDDTSFEKLNRHRPLCFRYEQLPAPLQSCLLRMTQKKEEQRAQNYEQARKDDPTIPPYRPLQFEPKDLRLRYLMHGEGARAQLHVFHEAKNDGASHIYPFRLNGGVEDLWHKEIFERTQRRLPANRRAVNRKAQQDIALTGRYWGDIAEQLHQQTGCNIFTDSFLSPPDSVDNRYTEAAHSFDEGTRLSDILAKSGEWGRRWWQEGGAGNDILLCSSWWYEVHRPNRYEDLLHLMQRTRNQERLFTLDDLAEIYTLPGVMISWLEEATGAELFLTERHTGVYRLYHSLSAAEKRALVDSGLKKTSLASARWTEFEDVLNDIHSGLTDAQRESAVLTLECNKDGLSVLNLKWGDGAGGWLTEEVMHCGLLPAFVQKQREKEKSK